MSAADVYAVKGFLGRVQWYLEHPTDENAVVPDHEDFRALLSLILEHETRLNEHILKGGDI